DALSLAKALYEGWLPLAEVTFRTGAAEESIRRIAGELPEMLVGAGTVLTIDQVDRAAAAGAKFIVTPGFNRKVVEHCLAQGLPVVPGCSGPSDMEAAIEMGLDVVKFFPAEPSGGVEYLKAVAGPYTSLKFMPTGGINVDNLNAYLSLKNVVACGGSWMVKPELINAGDFAAITELTRQAVMGMLGFDLLHVGVNTASENDAAAIAGLFGDRFGMPAKAGKSSIFAGTILEVMKMPGRGKFGHIAISTRYIERAIAHFRLRGIVLDENSRKYNDAGKLTTIYFADEPGGFAVHLTQV
ncbi:MAG: bifunctional 4-hydroxy-2-oxoglutarate aldolase/2-dehydro-3-deoxy-phosphogluconate aldolase, partial [Rectinemataceae bacterium]|nr:bifunctional 4-hydroxy-2-oxoglutarate aldolase/2-dehydro-3-deoxy-phosphogluconate aldolase [Rectinemataceae bacterium]